MTGLLVRRRAARPPIQPLDQPAAELLFGGQPLTAWVDAAALSCGLQVVSVAADEPAPTGAVAIIDDDVLVDGITLGRLLRVAGQGPPRQAAVAAETSLWRASAVLTDAPRGVALRVPLWAGAVAGRRTDELAGCDVAVVADDAGARSVDVRPYGPPPHVLQIADVTGLLGWPRHWLHVLELSLASLLVVTRDASWRPDRLRGQRIHPTAHIQRSVLGANVIVEAHAAIIDSVIGDDVLVGDHTVIHTSVVGAGCRTLVDTHLRRVVAMGGSTLSNLDMQDAIFGREIFLTTGVAYFHDGPGRTVEVDGQDSGRPVLSGAIGRRAVLGSRALFRSGVALPAGALVVARPEEAIGKFDAASLAKAAMRIGDPGLDV